MARLESLLIGGYYAFPDQHLADVAALFEVTAVGTRILDPCAGEGRAILSLTKHLQSDAEQKRRHVNVIPHAIELEPDRAEECRSAFTQAKYFHRDLVIEDDIFLAEVSPAQFGMIFCNPPFTWDTAVPGKRRELGMLQHSWRWLQDEGWMVFVSYSHHLSYELLEWVTQRSKQVEIYRLPELHFDTYCQTVLLAQKTSKVLEALPLSTASTLYEDAQDPEHRLYTLKVGTQQKRQIPYRPAPRLSAAGHPLERFVFHRGILRESDLIEALNRGQGADGQSAFIAAVTPKPEQDAVRPAMNVRRGHLLTLVAAGMFNYVNVTTPEGKQGILRSVIRYEEKLVKEEETNKGKQEIYQLTPVTHASILKDTGEIEYFKTEARLLNLLENYSDQLFAHIAKTHQPLYVLRGDTPLKRRWLPHFHRQRVKGKYPLLPAQMHVGAAVCTLLDDKKRALLVGQMSTGKTSLALSIMDAWRREGRVVDGQVMWVSCPNHLVKKWAREASQQHPNCRVTLLALEVDGERVDMMSRLSDAMRQAQAEPKRLHIIIAAQDAVKLGEGWEPAYHVRRERAYCPSTGQALEITQAELKQKQRFNGRHALWQEVRKFRLPKRGNGRAERVGDKVVSLIPNEPILDEWLALKGVRPQANPRGPVWRLLKTHYKGRIAIAFFDETHQSNNIATDRYRAMSAIARASDCVVGLSGTIFNGNASSLYGLETIFDAQLFQRYAWGSSGISAWIRDMGVLEKVIEYRDEYRTNGTYTGTKRISHAAREAPGASPLLIQRIIGHTVFINLVDLGKALPALNEQPAEIAMSEEQASIYKATRQKLADYLKKCKQSGDNSFLGTYYHALLKYPDHALLPEEVRHQRTIRDHNGRVKDKTSSHVHKIPMLSANTLPKDDWLVERVQTEIAEGRGVAIYVTHSGTELSERLASLLKKAGAKPVVMTSKVPAIEREAWIETQFNNGINVLICNPRLVETGLDLIMCPTLIFFEPEPQFGVLKQSAHRHWRIPQTKDCRTFYAYYAETMQERLTAKTAKKLKAHNIVNGESAALSALNDFESYLDDLVDESNLLDLHAEFAALNQRDFDDSEWLDGIEYADEVIEEQMTAPTPAPAKAETNQAPAQKIANQTRKANAEALRLERSYAKNGTSWWWLYGDTYPHRTLIKANGGRWSTVRKAWWFAGGDVPPQILSLVNGKPEAEPELKMDTPRAIVPEGFWGKGWHLAQPSEIVEPTKQMTLL